MCRFVILKFQDVRFVWTVTRNTHNKFGWNRIITVEGVALWTLSFQKNRKCTERPQNNLEHCKIKRTPYMFSKHPESQIPPRIPLRLVLRWAVFQIIEIFYFAVEYKTNVNYKIFNNNNKKKKNNKLLLGPPPWAWKKSSSILKSFLL